MKHCVIRYLYTVNMDSHYMLEFYNHHFLHTKMPVPSQEYGSCCPFVWCVCVFEFAIWLVTFRLEFSSEFSIFVISLSGEADIWNSVKGNLSPNHTWSPNNNYILLESPHLNTNYYVTLTEVGWHIVIVRFFLFHTFLSRLFLGIAWTNGDRTSPLC